MKIVSLALGLLLVCPQAAALAQGVPQATVGSWEEVKALTTDAKLEVELKDGTTMKGEMIDATDTKLSLARGGRAAEVDRADVRRVYRVASKSKGRRALIGFAIGAGAGVGVGAIVGVKTAPHESGEAHVPAALGGIVGAGFGALGGFLTGFGTKRVLVYESRWN